MKLTNKYKSAAYWTQLIQIMLYDKINSYLSSNNLSQKAFAQRLGVSKGYVSQILNGDFDHKLSKLTELALACDMVPKIEFVPIEYAEQVAKTAYIQPTDWKCIDNDITAIFHLNEATTIADCDWKPLAINIEKTAV